MANPSRRQRQPIRPRLGMESLTAPLNSAGGRGIGVAASPTNALGSLHGNTVFAPGSADNGKARMWANLSSSLGNLLRPFQDRLDREQARAERAAERAQIRAENAAEEMRKEAQAQIKARQEGIDRIHGAAVGNRLLSEVEEKTRLGEIGLFGAEDYIQSRLAEEGMSPAGTKAAEAYVVKALGIAEQNDRGRILETQTNEYLAVIRQGFADLHSAYDPDKPEEYAAQRTAIYDSRKTLGISGEVINEIEMTSLVNQAKRYASIDPIRAESLLDLAEQKRPDGSPSLAASARDGYTTLERLRDEVAATILAESSRERIEAENDMKSATRENFINDIITVSRLENAEAAKKWAVENVDSLPPEALRAKYGDNVGEMLGVVERAKSNQKPEGNDAALTEWTMAIQRGTAEWEDVNRDKRLSDKQKAQVFGTMKDVTQRAALGYVSDAQLAAKLLTDLEKAWPDSVYGTPWTASRQIEPGEPPVITPEGLYYQGELFRKLRDLDPDLDVIASNRKKMEIFQDVKNAVVSGKLRFRDNAGSLQETFPELKLSEKVKEGERLSDPDVSALGKALHDGGAPRIRDVYSLDYFTLDPQDRKRIASEAQRQKAELDALRANTFFGWIEESPDALQEAQQLIASEAQRQQEVQQLDEAARLLTEYMELERSSHMGKPGREYGARPVIVE